MVCGKKTTGGHSIETFRGGDFKVSGGGWGWYAELGDQGEPYWD